MSGNSDQNRRISVQLGEPDSTRAAVIVGDNELSNMTRQAAIDYGVHLDVIDTRSVSPASSQTAGYCSTRPDVADLGQKRVLTFATDQISGYQMRDFELGSDIMRPGPHALNFSRDLLYLREALCSLGDLSIATPKFSTATSATDVDIFAQQHGWPVVLKSRWTENDNRKVQIIMSRRAADRFLGSNRWPTVAFETRNQRGYWLVEEFIEPANEFVVLIARRRSGYWISYPPIEIGRQGGIAFETSMPANLPERVVEEATQLGASLLSGIDATGIAALRFLWTTDKRLLLDQISLRPHIFGNLTLEGCQTSQFHQHIRAIFDWPLGSSTLRNSAAALQLIGKPENENFHGNLASVMSIPNTFLHLYSCQWQIGQPFGHVSALGVTADEALSRVREAAIRLCES